MAFECGARRILVLHHRRKGESRHKRDGKRVCHGLVVLLERIFEDVQAQALIQVFKEYLAQMVAFLDDDGVLRTQLV